MFLYNRVSPPFIVKPFYSEIKSINKNAVFNGCIGHSLNLSGQHSFAESTSCVTFFGTIEKLYIFFSGSTHRWDVLLTFTKTALKRLCTTRWSAHHDSVMAVRNSIDECISALNTLTEPVENMDTRGAAQSLLPAVCNFSFLCYLFFWSTVLKEVDNTQKYLQTKELSLDKAYIKLVALKLYLFENRDHLVDNAIKEALKKAEEYDIETEKRVRYKKRMPGEITRDAGLSWRDEIRKDMLQCIDRFHTEIDSRSKSMEDISEMFISVTPKAIVEFSAEELKGKVSKLTDFYDEISEDDLLLEIPRVKIHLKASRINLEEVKLKWTLLNVLQFIAEMDLIEECPNLTLSLKLFLTICVSVSSCERSFSKLKLIKSYLRSTMGQERLSGLAVLSIENEATKYIDFDYVINDFAALTARKVAI